MKFRSFLFLCLILPGCANDLEIFADYKDIPVVYGLLSLTEDQQFIRVEKAFSSSGTLPGEAALVPDSIYYENLSVFLRKEGGDQLYALEKVNGADYGFPRDTGAFAASPNILYRINSGLLGLRAGERVQLEIERGSTLPPVTAETIVIDSVLIALPSGRVNFDYVNNFTIQWFPKSEAYAPHIYDAGFLINYRELDITDPDPTWRELTLYWPVESATQLTRVQKQGSTFYLFLADQLAENPNLRRELLSLDVIITSGGSEILDYTRVGLANLGITASQELPFYTNISEGRGLFSSRNTNLKKRILLSPVTRDSLAMGQFTRHLNFIN